MTPRSVYVRRAMRRAGSMCGWRGRAPSSPSAVSRRPIGCSWRRARSSARRSCICTACCSPRGRSILLLQTTFAARGRVDRHRAWGLLGISLATAMVLVGFAVANEVLATRLAAGFGDRARAFHIASTSMITLFGVFVCAAIAYVRRPEIHKRLMLLATISMLPPAIARLFFAVSVGIGPGLRPGLGPPRTVESVLAPALIADALILAGVIYDMRTRGRPHPAYLIGGAHHARRPVPARAGEHDTLVVRDRGLSRAVQRLGSPSDLLEDASSARPFSRATSRAATRARSGPCRRKEASSRPGRQGFRKE